MSNYSALIATINANIKANNNHEITGSITNSVLNAMVNSLGAGYQFIGVATPTNPGSAQTPDYKCFYLATTPGTYTNLGGLVVADGEVALLKWDTTWTKEVTGIATEYQLNQLGQIVGNGETPYSFTNGYYLGVDMQPHSDNLWLYTDYIPVQVDDIIKWTYNTKDEQKTLVIYDAQKNPIDYYRASIQDVRTIVLLEQDNPNASYIRVSMPNNISGINVEVNDVVVWEQYNHEIRISRNEAKIGILENEVKPIPKLEIVVGNPTFPDKYEDNVYLDTNANLQTREGYLVTDFIPVVKGDNILWRYGNIDTNMCLCVYDASKNLISGEYYRAALKDERAITIVENGAFIRASLPKGTDYWVKDNNEYVFQYSIFKSHEERITDLEKGIDGTPIILNVGTYNTGKFEGEGLVTPSDEGSLTYRKTIGGLNVNILGTQEDMLYYSSMTEGEDVRKVIFPMFRQYYRSATGQTNIKGFGSDYDIANVQRVSYTGATFNHPWFLVGELTLKGKTILLASFHFDWADVNRRALQIQQLMQYASTYDYAILMGDANVDNCTQPDIHDVPQRDNTHPFLYEEEFAIFKNAGYDLANGGNFGYFGTFLDKEVHPEGQWIPFDNIYVKGGVIRDAYPVTKEYMNDHKPVCAVVVI